MTKELEDRVAALEERVDMLHAANFAHLMVFAVALRFLNNNEQVLTMLGVVSEGLLTGKFGAKPQGLTPAQGSIAADVVDSIAEQIKAKD